MQKVILLLLPTLFLTLSALAQQPEPTEAEREQNAQQLIDQGVLPPNFESLLPPDSLGLNTYYSPERAYRVYITSKQGIVSTLDVPLGTHLNVQADQALNLERQELTATSNAVYRGDIIIRTRRKDEVEASDGSAAFAIMAKSPVAMVLRDVVVEVEARGN